MKHESFFTTEQLSSRHELAAKILGPPRLLYARGFVITRQTDCQLLATETAVFVAVSTWHSLCSTTDEMRDVSTLAHWEIRSSSRQRTRPRERT